MNLKAALIALVLTLAVYMFLGQCGNIESVPLLW